MQNYQFAEVEFEPIKLSDLIGGSNHEIIVSRVFGRIDLSLNKSSIRPKDMIAQSTENSPPASIHVNKRIDEKKAMSKTVSNGNASLNIYNNITALNKNVIVPQGNNFTGSRHSLDKQRGLDYSYDEVLPQIS